MGAPSFDLRALLSAVENASPIDAVDVMSAELAGAVDARHVSLLIANFSATGLGRLSHVAAPGLASEGRHERVETIALPGTAHDRVLVTQKAELVERGTEQLLLVPVTERGDAVGILEVSLPGPPDTGTVEYLEAAAHALAYVLIAARRHTDLFEWAQRDVPFSVSAEIQRRLLPSAYTTEAGPVTLAGWLEPSHSAGGDSFDYSLERDYLYASLSDAMGHSTQAALLATLALGTLRNRRRALASPAEQADAASASLIEHATVDQFVTAVVMRVRVSDGLTEIVNAGHPPPFLVRGGTTSGISDIPQPPLGVSEFPYRTDIFTLLPGDRLLVVTDGFLERNASRVDIEGILASGRDRHPREIVRELARNVLEVTEGNLGDDATALCIDWYGRNGNRHAASGASQTRATTA